MRFVIICAARTGSSHFVNLLSGHPDVFMNGNIFDARQPNRLYVFWPKDILTREVRQELIGLRAHDPWAFLERIYETPYGRKVVGFKIFNHENDEILRRILMDGSIAKIVLFRRNVLANYSSALVARLTGQYGAKKGSIKAKTPKVRFDARKFVRFHDRYVGFFASVMDTLARERQKFHFITYEDVNEPRLLTGAAGFLGLDTTKEFSSELQIRDQIKQNSSDILSRFANRRRVEQFLSQNGLLHWAHEGRTLVEQFPSDLQFAPIRPDTGASARKLA